MPQHTIRDLKAEAANELRQARNIREAADNNGGLTQEKRNQITAHMDRIDELKEQWELMEREEGYSTSLADSFTVDDDDVTTVAAVRSRGNGLPNPDPEVHTDDADAGWEPGADDADFSIRTTAQRNMLASQNYGEAFYSYMRQRGMTQVGRQALQQQRTMVEGTDADGGFLAPTQLVAGIAYEERQYRELKASFTNINTSARSLTFTQGLDSIVMGWVAELGTKPEDQLTFGRTVLVPHVGAVVVWVSDELLEDETFGLQGYIQARVAEAKVLLEEEAFISGSGSGRPYGLLTRLNAQASTPQRYETAGAAITGDDLLEVVYSQPRRYRVRSEWVFGTEAIKQIRLLKDGNDQYIWAPGLVAGEPQTILGYPVREVDAAALNSGVATGDDIGIFGDLRRYRVMNRLGLQMKRLEELRSLTDEVGFRFRFRTGGDIELYEAFKTIRIGS